MSSETQNFADRGDILTDDSHRAFVGCIDRLEQLVDRETQALKKCVPIDFEEFNARKSRALLELSRVSRSFPAQASTVMGSKLMSLQARLVENSLMLDQHLRAMREIAGIMIKTMEMAESDGTYSGKSSNDQYMGWAP